MALNPLPLRLSHPPQGGSNGKRPRRPNLPGILLLGYLGLLAFLLLGPLFSVVFHSLQEKISRSSQAGWSFKWYKQLLLPSPDISARGVSLRAVINSLRFALGAVAIALPLGTILALGACRTYASRLDFCPFSLLRRCQECWFCQGKTCSPATLRLPQRIRRRQVALQQEKIIKNRLEGLKSDRLLGTRRNPSRNGLLAPGSKKRKFSWQLRLRNPLPSCRPTNFAIPDGPLESSKLPGKNERSRGYRSLSGVLLMLPLGISPIILGLGYLKLLSFLPPSLRGGGWAIIGAHAVIGYPFVLRSVSASLHGFPPLVHQAAASLGASPWRTFLTVELPLMKAGIFTGAAFAFALSLGEINATILLARSQQTTIPLAIHRLIGAYNFYGACVLGTLLMVLCGAAFFIIDRFEEAGP